MTTISTRVICGICFFPVDEDPAHPGLPAGHTCAGTAPTPVWPDAHLTAAGIDKVLLTLAERARECENPADPEEWASTRHQVAAANAYREAARILREAAGRAA